MQKKNYLRKTLALVMAFLMIVTMLPVNVFADPTNPGQGSNLPSNRVQKVNWAKVYDKTSNIWKLNQDYNLDPAQQLTKVSAADVIDNYGLSYEGYFVNAEGRTVLRLVYHESSTLSSTWWWNLLFKFDKDLFSKIDFSESFIEYFNGQKLKFYDTQGSNEKALKIRDLIVTDRAGWKHNMPIDLVLNDGVKYSDLKDNYLIQMRFATPNLDKIYTFAPGKSPMDYSSYTKATIVAAKSNVDTAFMRGPKPQSALIVGQRSFMTEYDNEAQTINQKPNTDKTLAVLKTQYQWEHASMNKANTIDGKPFGYMIAFDASLVPYLKADSAGNVGYTTLQDADKVENVGNAQYPYIKTALKLGEINYTPDNKIAYFVLAEDNFKKTNVKVVTIGQMDGSIYQGTDNFTNIDFVVDKNAFIKTFTDTPDQEQIRFGVVAGWVETNPKGMTIFEKTFDNGLVIPAGGSLNIDTNGAPEGGQIMVQVGDGDNFIKRYQPYYNALRNVSNFGGFDGMELLANGIYSVPYRTGITIKAGQKLRVYMPDTADNDDVRLFYLNNATEWNKGGVDLSFDNQSYNGEIKVHIGAVPHSVELIYTLKGQSTPKTTKFTKRGTWQHNGGSELVTINSSILGTGGDYILKKSMLEPGTEVIARAYSRTGDVKESSIKYDAFTKSSERYEGLVITDNSDVLSSLAINKSVLVPYQQVYTNDYAQGQDDFYKTVDVKPISKDAFNTKTNQLVGYASYDGGPVRLRLLPNNNKTYLGKADAAESLRDKDGFITNPMTTKVTVDGKEYDKYEYTVNIADLVDSSDNTTKIPNADQTLKKDMRILVSNSDGSSIPSDWYETRVRTRVLFDANKDFNWNVEATSIDSTVKIVPDSAKFFDEDGYTANGFSETSGAILKDTDGKNLQGKDLELRQWPQDPASFTKDGKTYKFLGWSTKQVTPEEFAKADKLTQLDQWKDTTKAYKVTENSPIDSHQIVYGVWGEGLKIYLHSNNGANETVKEVVVLASAFKNGIANIDIPKAPYWNGDNSVTDNDMKKFINETEFTLPRSTEKDIRHTFIGWSTDRDDTDLLVGFNYSELAKDNTTLPDDRKNKLSEAEYNDHSFKLDTLGKYSYQYTDTTTNTTVDKTTQLMLPNGYKLRLDGTYDEWLNKDYIHLYAQYRPFFGVQVNKDYKYIENENTTSAKYVNTYTDTKNKVHTINYADKRNVLIGLLYRTAVTDYTDPTVHAAAKYFVIDYNKYYYSTNRDYSGYDLQPVYDTPTNTKANFVVPGFDALGQRLSYSAVETKVGEEDKYYNFKNDWADLGIVIYTRIPAPGQPAVNEGPIAPDTAGKRREAKIQYFDMDDGNPNTFDAFTSATIRKSIKNPGKGDFDIQGYSINMHNVPREIPKPQFDKIYDGDTVAYIDREGIDTEFTYKGLSLTLPGETLTREYIYNNRDKKWDLTNAAAAVIGYSVYVEPVKIDGKDKIKITRTENFGNPKPFKANEQIKAQFGVNTLGLNNTYGPEGSITVLKLPTNIPVDKVVQEKNIYNDATDPKHEHPQVVISSEIPAGTGGVLYEPEAGTIYTLVKEDGTPIVDKNNQPITYEKTAGEQQGTPFTFPPFDPVKNSLNHKDKVYIKTTLPPKDRRTFKPVTSTAFAELILEGPISKINYQDDYYRRWLDVTVDMKDKNYPVVGNFKITIDFKDGSTARTIDNITSMEKVQEILRELYRDDNIKKITVVGEDKFGNRSENEVAYKEPKQIEVKFIMPRSKDKQIKVSGPVGTEVTVTINPGTSNPEEHKIILVDGLNTIQLTTPIKKGDRISIYGEQKQNGVVVGKTNPMTFTVRR